MPKETLRLNNPEMGAEFTTFPHLEVERKWMNKWVDDNLYRANDFSNKPKFFVLDMYPYPSGSGLHVGHVEGYTATDIISRYKRMNGFEVLHPMGWDAFGLPTENYAIKTGKDPHKVTRENTDTFRGQCIRTGFSIDWTREIDTSSPEYYKWTQELFATLYENDLAYKKEAPVNWCDSCVTVIANEQVKDGCCERCNTEVITKNIEQWFFKITDYADELIDGLNTLDWPESTKEGQKNWIGRTEGYEISLNLNDSVSNIELFLTKPELLSSSSYILIAPEHPDLYKIIPIEIQQEVEDQLSNFPYRTELQRKQQSNNTGVFSGSYALNPITGKDIPIFISDDVIMDEFGGIKLFTENNETKKISQKNRNRILRQLREDAKPSIRYNLRDWLVSRERYWGAPIPIIHCDSCGDNLVPREDLPVLLPKMDDFTPTGEPPLSRSEEFLHTSCPCCGEPAIREAKTLDTFVDSSWYFLRFADPHNPNAMSDKDLVEKWLPVDYYVGGADHTTGHLLYARFITKVLHNIGRINLEEPFTKLVHQGMILGEDRTKMSKRGGNVVNPLDVSDEYGSDALRLYEMFMGPLEQSKVWNTKGVVGPRRFIDKVWRIQNKVKNIEPTHEEIVSTNNLIEVISNYIESGKYNTAISEFMKYINVVEKYDYVSKESFEVFIKLLAPFAPFITEELWENLGNTYSVHLTNWPQSKEKYISNQISLPIMINNKFITSIQIGEGIDLSESDIREILSQSGNLDEDFTEEKIKKIIYKKGKVINVLLKK